MYTFISQSVRILAEIMISNHHQCFFSSSSLNRNVFCFQWNMWNSWTFINTRNKEMQRNSLWMDCVRSADCNSLRQIIINTRLNQIALESNDFQSAFYRFYIIAYLISTHVVESARPSANKTVGALNGKSFKFDQRKHFLMFMVFFFLDSFDERGEFGYIRLLKSDNMEKNVGIILSLCKHFFR